MPGADWFPGARLSYAEHIFRGRDDAAVAIDPRVRAAPASRADLGRAARAGRGHRRGTARAGRRARRPGRRPTCRTSRRRSRPSSRARASARPGRAARRTSAPAASSTASRRSSRRCCSPSTATATAGKDFDRRDAICRASQGELPTLEHTVVAPYLDPDATAEGLDAAWPRCLRCSARGELAFAQLPFDHPLWVLYSSGHDRACRRRSSTARAAILLEHLKNLQLHADLQAGDRMFWFTTTGWMMWNFLVGGLLTDARSCSTTAAPRRPDLDALWDLAAGTRHDLLRHERGLHRGLHRRPASSRAAGRDLSRAARASARPARRSRRRASAGSTSTSARTPGCSPRAAAPTCVTRVRRRRADPARLRGRAAGAARSARRSRRGTSDGRPVDRRGRRARDHRADAVDAALLLGRSRRRAATTRATSRCTRASGATATGSRSPPAARAII